MKRALRFVVPHKYWFDVGSALTSQAMGAFNSSMLLVLVADRKWPGHAKGLVFLAALAYVGGTWLIGIICDKSGYADAITREHNARNPALAKLQESHDAR